MQFMNGSGISTINGKLFETDTPLCPRAFLVVDSYGIKFFNKGFVNTHEDNIRERGAMYKLISDNFRPEVKREVEDIINSLSVQRWQSETQHRLRRPIERNTQYMKRTTNGTMGHTITPAGCWFITVLSMCFLLNHLPFPVLARYRPVYYRMSELTFSLNFKETLGRFIRIAEQVGHPLTHTVKLLLNDIWRVSYQSEVRSALDKKCRILRVNSTKTDYCKGEQNKKGQGNSNLHHDWTNGCSSTGILHFISQRPITLLSKNQNTLGTAIYDSKIITARIAVKRIMNKSDTPPGLGAMLSKSSFVFGDNNRVVGNSIQPDARQHKQNTMPSIHHVRGAMSSMFPQRYHNGTNIHPAGILKKHWSYSDTCDDCIPYFTGWFLPSTSLLIMRFMAQSATTVIK
ncbi:hypothetical protein IV203_032538 [Nitzschia inconspicua]|uniref:Uncharacterized protein n=1 Tax=Nitzschia inconspicua TaxID=303405 RepID=A0A9K3KJW0_9STRA|nr:hypothetical protein IV203_032538 [Nitzschia inconspicua]